MDLPLSSCSLSLVSITGSPSLSVSFQRSALDRMSVENVVVTMEGISLNLTREGQSISGQRVQLPYKNHSIQIEMVGSYIKCSSIMGFSLLWDQNNAITVKLDPKFHTKTTGLCGDFNGIADDLYLNGHLRSESDYTLMNKLNNLEMCSQEPQQTNSDLSREYCLNKTQHIQHLLQGELLSCVSIVDHQLKSLLINISLSDICRLDCNGTAGLYPCDGCATIAEFSRRCTQANGSPGTWRSPEFCGVTCPRGQVHRECGPVCKDTCSNPSASINCPSTCVDGCFCPEGMVWDDVSGSGCIPQSNCGCNQLGHSYASGESLITGCKNCTCEQGQWNCDSRPCYGTCKILGGSYFSTFDSKTYRFHGDCFYTLTTDCAGKTFSVLGELTKCEGRDSKTCLNSVILYIDDIKMVVFKASGDVLVHENKVPLPFVSASVTVVQESSFYLRAETNFGLRLRVQLKPLMQLYITAATAYHNKTCGLCGNFNEVTGDDFTHSGIVDATAATFCNMWKAQATCPDRKEVTMDPCSVYTTNNEYAKTYCGLLMDNDGPFSTCHSVVSADEYYMRCKYDTCSCSYPEPCLCAALSAYAYACAAHGVVLVGWRSDICSLDSKNCPISHEFSYAAPECGSASCRASRASRLVCRGVRPPPFELPSPSPVEGCVCGAGLYDDEHGVCVLKSDCPCYSEMSGDVIRAGVTVDLHDTQCLCTGGELHCFGLPPISGNTCEGQMTYHNCSDGLSEGSAACQRTCANPHSICYSPGCVSGCVCPGGLLVDHNGNCVSEEQCTCEHNGQHYNPGDTITQLCNNCTCMNAQWSCTSKVCQGLCFVYGEGHHTTFDGKQYVFDGSCQYILSQDSCGNSSGSFRITTENEPCGTTGTTCSKKVHFFVGADELVLTDGTVKGSSLDLPGSPFHVRRMGIYTVVETSLGVTVIWDGHTAVSVHVNPQLKGHVCGLCGDYDGKVANDFVTRTGSVAASAPEFAAGWKESGSGCPDLSRVSDPCTINHHRESWAHKQCSVLKDGVFKQCHNMVEYLPYYTACVRDSCGCDTGGDCHCLCTALASYAQACGSAGVCLRWRTPDLCPLGCDLYNKDEDQCEWHYRECGRGCQRSCTNRNAICTANLPPLEGCYPTCSSDRPFLNESSMTCVKQCDCVSNGTTYKANDRIPSNNSCEICSCTIDGISCTIIPGCPQHTTTITATTTESTTTTSSSTVPPTTISTTSESTTRPPSTTGTPSTTSEKTGHAICGTGVPMLIDCRARDFKEKNLSETGTDIMCDVNKGLLCLEEKQDPLHLTNYHANNYTIHNNTSIYHLNNRINNYTPIHNSTSIYHLNNRINNYTPIHNSTSIYHLNNRINNYTPIHNSTSIYHLNNHRINSYTPTHNRNSINHLTRSMHLDIMGQH
ncbi:mucin-2-like [Lethenteron reissneri]|uniref:mucin-2-like n=1 Tax=Lethenteron reissneri TaxID=7753 RepID=UPI002AB71AE4|nr:mucin-2-like [Lethenteron reissneri]